MAADLTEIGGYLKKFYSGPIRDQLNSATALDGLIKKSEAISGETLTANIPMRYQRNQGVGPRAENTDLPTAGNLKHKYSTAALAFYYGQILVTGQAMKASRDNAHSFARAIQTEIEGMVKGMKLEKNRTWLGDGSGAMARVDQTTGSVTAGDWITVDNAGQLEAGMIVDFYDAKSAGTKNLDSKTIAAVDPINNRITLSTTETVTDNDYIFREDSRGLYGMGILGLIDGLDSAGNRIVSAAQGLTRSSNRWFESTVFDNGGTLRDLTLDLMQQAFEAGEIVGQGECKVILTDHMGRRAYLAQLVADRRYVKDMKLSGGFSALEYVGGGASVPLVAERMMWRNTMYFLDTGSLSKEHAGDAEWMDGDGAVLRKVANRDSYEATIFEYYTMACDAANRSSVLRDIQ